jgi:hypothetical protein
LGEDQARDKYGIDSQGSFNEISGMPAKCFQRCCLGAGLQLPRRALKQPFAEWCETQFCGAAHFRDERADSAEDFRAYLFAQEPDRDAIVQFGIETR